MADAVGGLCAKPLSGSWRNEPSTGITIKCLWCGSQVSSRHIQSHFEKCPRCPSPSEDEQICSKCQQPKPLEDFDHRSNNLKGRSHHCKRCTAKYSVGWRVNGGNDSAVRSHRLKRYGITSATYDVMVAAQGNRCAICRGHPDNGGHPKQRHLAVDHCHSTGTIRGLLCAHCNRGLGHFMDSPDLLDAAKEYLLRHRPELSTESHSKSLG